MTVDEVREWVKRIDEMRGDDEVAHAEEDRLHQEVLNHIAHSRGKHAELALAALATRQIKFARWCA